MISIVTGATIGDAQAMVIAGGPVQIHILSLLSVTVNAPSHIELAGHFHLIHFCDVSVALSTVKAAGDVYFM